MQYIDMIFDLLKSKKDLLSKSSMISNLQSDTSTQIVITSSAIDGCVCLEGIAAKDVLTAAQNAIQGDIGTIDETLVFINNSIKSGFDTRHIKRQSWD